MELDLAGSCGEAQVKKHNNKGHGAWVVCRERNAFLGSLARVQIDSGSEALRSRRQNDFVDAESLVARFYLKI